MYGQRGLSGGFEYRALPDFPGGVRGKLHSSLSFKHLSPYVSPQWERADVLDMCFAKHSS
jgi:hypothetical protein